MEELLAESKIEQLKEGSVISGTIMEIRPTEVVIDFGGKALNLLTTAVDFGYKLVDGAERIVGKIFGEEGAKKFKTFMENLTNLVNAFLVWKIIGKKIFTSIIKNIKNK